MWRSVKDDPPTMENCGNSSGEVLYSSHDGYFFVGKAARKHVGPRYWQPIEPLPKHKIWREPTQADLDKAKEPIPCRIREGCNPGVLLGIAKFGRVRFAVLSGGAYGMMESCEIEVEE